MISSDGKSLSIFVNFEEEDSDINRFEQNSFTLGSVQLVPENKKSFTEKLFAIVAKKKELSPDNFFRSVSASLKDLNEEDFQREQKNLQTLYMQAKANGQKALVERLESQRERIERELMLKSLGYLYIEEEDVIKFAKQSSRALKLDWIKNFSRVIPDRAVKKLSDARTLEYEKDMHKIKVFGNYVIMHYDPNDIGTELTKKEKTKDPILFGVMRSSNRLYFIDDWIDEYCDLTLNKMLCQLDLNPNDRVLTTKSIVNKE
jgi:hypothetical protein